LRALTPEITLRDDTTTIDDQPVNDILDRQIRDLHNQQNETCDSLTNNTSNPSNTTTIMSSSSLIGPFKSEFEVCLFMSQRQDLVDLTLNIMKASGHEPEIIQRKADKSNILSDKVSLIYLLFYCIKNSCLIICILKYRNLESCNCI